MPSLTPLPTSLAGSPSARPASRVLTQFAVVVFAVLGAGLLLGKMAVDAVIAQVEREELDDSITRTRLALERRERRATRQAANLASNARTQAIIVGPRDSFGVRAFTRDFFESPPPLDLEFVMFLSPGADAVFTWRLPGTPSPPRPATYLTALSLADRGTGIGSGYVREGDTVYMIGVAAVPLHTAGGGIAHVLVGRAMTGPTIQEIKGDLRLGMELLPPATPLPATLDHSERLAGGDSVRILFPLPGIGDTPAAVVEVRRSRTGLRTITQWTLFGAAGLLLFGALAVVLVWQYGRRLLLTPLRNIALEIVAMHGRGELSAIDSPPPTSEWALFVTTFNDTVRSLRDTEQRYRVLFDRSIDPFFLIDAESGRVVDANPAAAALTGISRALLRDAPLPDTLRGPPASGAVRHTRPDGITQTWGVVETTVQFGGRAMSLVAYRDLTDREALAQSQKMQAIGSLAGGIAHDFNNLMGSVLAGVRVARDAEPTDRRATSALDAIEHAGRRAAELTRQLIGLSAQEPLVRVPVDVGAAIENITRMCESTFDRRVHIVVDVPPQLPAIDGDPGQLEQALLNLAINARDAMPAGGTLRISAREAVVDATRALTIRDIQPAHYVIVSVEDEGVGMTDDVKSRIFEPFYTTKGPGKGTGLGLAMVYGLARNSGGTVTVESVPDAGARFDIYFPASTSRATVRPATPAGDAPPSHLAALSTRPVVLLCDDESGLREMVRMVLESEGLDVIEAANGADAVEVVAREADRLGVVLLDVQMPVMGGVEAFGRIRQLAPDLPVILGTGFVGDHELSAIHALGADDLLTKPYDLHQLLERLVQLSGARN